MGNRNVVISIPLDSDGFLRRECPLCEQQFKWWSSPSEDIDSTSPQIESYFCPYCHESASPDQWWTKEQLDYVQRLASAEIMGPELHRFGHTLENLNTSGGLLHIDVQANIPAPPVPLSEPDDMVRVEFPCHLEEPIKVDPGWEGEVACLMCGIQYPVDLVRALPDLEDG